jgi:GDP-4-dehydro-6-deoxy-D-mannose reductase
MIRKWRVMRVLCIKESGDKRMTPRPQGKILVTGASGFVGQYLVQAIENKENIWAAVFGNGDNLKPLLSADHIISGDLTDAHFTERLIQSVQPDTIYHLAALSVVQDSVEKAGSVLSSNLVLQYNLLESVRLHSPSARIVAICSAQEYGLVGESDIPINESTPLRPLNPYAVSKLAQDMLTYQYYLAYGMDVIRLRPFNHTGPGQTTDFVIPALAKQFAEIKAGTKKPVIDIGNIESTRDFTDVRDIVRAYVAAAEQCVAGEVYNIGYGKGITVSEVINLFQEIADVKVDVVTHPERIRHADVPVLLSDSSKFRTATGWHPVVPFRETLESVYNYYRDMKP